MKVVYLKAIFFSLFPVILIIGALVFIMLRMKKGKAIKFGVVVIVSSIFFQPTIVDTMFENLICKRIGEEYVLQSDFNIDCSDKAYKLW